jgi:acetate kinase
MAASLGGVDALVFTGGVGENLPLVRAETARRLSFLGVELDPNMNDSVRGDAVISPPPAPFAVLVIASREDIEIARQVRQVLNGPPH